MKKICNKQLLLSLFAVLFMIACNEDDFLREEPEDFFTADTAFITVEQFESALVDLYARTRAIVMNGGRQDRWAAYAQYFGTDMFAEGRDAINASTRFGTYDLSLNPTNTDIVARLWNSHYKIISNVNIILARLETSDLTDEEKNLIGAEAKFFRAFSYRFLVHTYGDVPLLLEEINEPKTDFTRTSRTTVLEQIAQDFSEAAAALPGITEVVDGKVHALIAQHYLSETYIALERWTDAINTASVVIDDPATGLMTERFGSLEGDPTGNVYWDLFRVGNQNRTEGGNMESLWVAQMETDVPGGLISTSTSSVSNLERFHGSLAWTLTDPDGNPGSIGPTSTLNGGGRGIVFIKLTPFWERDVWGADYDIDIRSQPVNLYRDQFYDNPESAYFGEVMTDFPSDGQIAEPWRVTPYLTKVTTYGQHPDAIFADKDRGILKNSAGTTFRDRYYARLAETYLLRAEAYHGNGQNDLAASDINMVRQRSSGSLVVAGDVDIDLILDERGKELSFESPRRLTLQRTGKLVERVRAQNPFNADDIQDFHNLFPIPLGNIEANVTGDLQQNPGY